MEGNIIVKKVPTTVNSALDGSLIEQMFRHPSQFFFFKLNRKEGWLIKCSFFKAQVS